MEAAIAQEQQQYADQVHELEGKYKVSSLRIPDFITSTPYFITPKPLLFRQKRTK
jgi:hypothetical protein